MLLVGWIGLVGVFLLTCVLVDDITLMMLCSELTSVLTITSTGGATDRMPVDSNTLIIHRHIKYCIYYNRTVTLY